jgi:CRISPR/Cas system-associated exonuclease Cas4 (RecB family)
MVKCQKLLTIYKNMARRFRSLNSTEEDNKDELLRQLRLKNEALNNAIAEFDSQVEDAIKKLWVDVESHVDQLNKAIENINGFVIKIKEEQEKYYDDCEDRWRNSESGEAYQRWKDAWDVDIEEIYLTCPSIEQIDEVEIDTESFEGLPHKVDF